MQTFLPYSDITESLRVLDDKRLGKQRVETFQIINAITGRPKLDGTPYKGWLNHPCSVMWRKHVPLLNPTNPYCWQDKEGKWYEQHSGTKGRVYYETFGV